MQRRPMGVTRGVGATVASMALVAAFGCSAPEPAQHGDPEVLLEAPDDEYVSTPTGRFHRSCVVEVEEGAVVDELGNVVRDGDIVQPATPCAYRQKLTAGLSTNALPPPPQVTPQWLQSIDALAPTNPFGGFNEFTLLTVDVKVPRAPTVTDGQLIYVFSGLQPFVGDYILQPVLQYGIGSPVASGYQWHLVSYFVRNQKAYYGPKRAVTPGETVSMSVFVHHAYTTPTGSYRQWHVKGTAASGTSLLAVGITSASHPVRAHAAVLEAYHFDRCSELPDELAIRIANPRLFMPSAQGPRRLLDPTWFLEMRSDPVPCGFSPEIVSPTSMRLNLERW